MDFRKLVQNVHAGKIAKIEGTAAELKQARRAISSLIDDQIVIERHRGCLYICKPVPLASISVEFLPRFPRQ